jgi:SAM-dependent methyltransferase
MAGRSGVSGGWEGAESHIRSNEPTRVRRMKYLAPRLPAAGGRVLEIGCSSGFMLLPLAGAGFDCVGVEPSGVFGEYVRSRGLPVHASVEELIAADGNVRYDLIQHFFVLEHTGRWRIPGISANGH